MKAKLKINGKGLAKAKDFVKNPKVLNAKKWVVEETSKAAVKVVQEVLDSDVPLPNIPQQVKEESKVWRTIAEVDGFKLQQNVVSQHGRILDKDNIRIKWGTMEGMEKAFERMLGRKRKFQNGILEENNERQMAIEELERLKKLHKDGILNDEEFEEKKKKYMEML